MIRNRCDANVSTRARRIVAAATAFTFFCQNFAWAVCADGTTFPALGFVNSQPPAANWSPGVFTGTAGSIFVPDNSVFENNDPTQPLTGGGHNWAFDQGTTTCKETDVGPAGGTPTARAIPLSNPTNCLLLPVITGTTGNPPLPIIKSISDVPFQGQTITPTCDPTLLSQPGAPNLANTRFNQLGCAISHGAATSPQTAITFLFVAGIKGGLFSVQLSNAPNPVVGGPAGKVISAFPNFYSDIPLGQKLTNAAVSPDGVFAVATSLKRQSFVYACLNPLGDPGDPSLPIDPNFSVPSANLVKCMQVGSNGLAADLTTAFGPDNQPYFGGQRTVDSFNFTPGGSSATAWPQCIFNGFGFAPPVPTTLMGELQAVFNAHSANHCGTALPNSGFVAAGVLQPQALISHGQYMYVSSANAPLGTTGNTVVQFKVTVDAASGFSQYRIRGYLTGAPLITGLGVADDLGSLLVFTDPSGIGAPGQEVITKLPLCEDF
ncbi:MAG TPA: hypothetical protein VKP67_08140 [Xanthobacteraceae bacterium]|nr:hypothetical protein [Xanthobacteraceae bacterium]